MEEMELPASTMNVEGTEVAVKVEYVAVVVPDAPVARGNVSSTEKIKVWFEHDRNNYFIIKLRL